MNFLDQILNKKKVLNKTQTLVTHADGKKYLEVGDQIELQPETSHGYVVDTKPDNVPACVTKFVYLGSQDCCDPTILLNHNINYVLSVGIKPSLPLLLNNLKWSFVECLDLPETNIIVILYKCLDFIDRAIQNECSILIHCNAGVSRSASIVIGYLMLRHNMCYDEAYNHVKKVRSCIRPNDGFLNQLKAFETQKMY